MTSTLETIQSLFDLHNAMYSRYIASVIERLRSGGIRRKPKIPKVFCTYSYFMVLGYT